VLAGDGVKFGEGLRVPEQGRDGGVVALNRAEDGGEVFARGGEGSWDFAEMVGREQDDAIVVTG
jgi:hypothetical protein